ncbi:MAG: hypothetical protein NTY08_16690 [Proteobacteria bacterium]|nr:hypothetical protein [Pseudomonadota bacterium]
MGAPKLTSAEKAAVVLLTLGEELASEIVGQMRPLEVTRIAAAMSRLGRVDAKVASEVASEFQDSLLNPTQGINGDTDAAQRLLRLAGHNQEAERLGSDADALSSELSQLLATKEPEALAALLQKEVPQTVTLIVAHCAPALASKTVQLLPPPLQVDILQRLARLGSVDAESLELIVTTLKQDQGSGVMRQSQNLGGLDKLVQLINSLGQAQGERLLLSLQQRDPELAEQVRRRLFTFADLVRIGDRGMQTLLAQVPAAALRLALKAADESVTAHIYKNLSERAAKLLKDDVAAMPKTRLQDVQASQQQIAEMAQALVASGKIEIMSKDETYV